MNTWTVKHYVNDVTGATRTVYRKVMANANGRHVYVEVYELAGRLYWSANIMLHGRPDLSTLAHGTFAAIPGALAVAKTRASRIAADRMRAAATPRGFSRAA